MLLGALSALSLISGVAVCLGTGAFAGLSWIWLLPLAFLGTFLVLAGIGFAFLMYLCTPFTWKIDVHSTKIVFQINGCFPIINGCVIKIYICRTKGIFQFRRTK